MWFGTALFKMVRLKFEITLHDMVNGLHDMVNGQTLTHTHCLLETTAQIH